MILGNIQLRPDDCAAMAVAATIADDLRHEDLYEFAAQGSNPKAVADLLPALASGDAWLFVERTGPEDLKGVFVWGVVQSIPGVYMLWGFGTKRTRRAMPQITRWGMEHWLPTFQDRHPGARRIEVRVPASSVHSIKWLGRLGMQVEARLPKYSVHGEDFIQLAMTFPEKVVSPCVLHNGLAEAVQPPPQ